MGFPPFLLIIKKNKMKTPMKLSILESDNAVLAFAVPQGKFPELLNVHVYI